MAKLHESYANELKSIKDDLNKKILSLRRLKGEKGKKMVEEINGQVEKASSIFKKFTKEIKQLKGDEKKEWDKKRKVLKQELSKMVVMFEQAQDQKDVDDLLQPGKSNDDPKPKFKNPPVVVDVENNKIKDDAVTDALFADVFKFQDEGLASLQRSLRMADEAGDLASKTLVKLKEQREQLERIDKEMDELGSNLQRARKELTSFMRRMATDKLIFVTCAAVSCLIFISIIVVIICKVGICKVIWKAVEKSTKKEDNKTEASCIICDQIWHLFD